MALPNYMQVINAVALQQMNKKICVPDVDLAIGAAECLSPLPVMVYKDLVPKIPKLVQKSVDQMAYEDTAENLSGAGLVYQDFATEGLYLGGAIGEV